MQAQSTNVQSITSAQSLASVQTLLKAGLGCIAFLRNLLPTDNFSESHFTSSNDGSAPRQSSDADDGNQRSKRNVSAFKIMTVTRGFTEEADKLLDYMEHGIFDALQKKYLRSFILAIHLDNKDPNNIVEAYTFNFRYHKIPGTRDTVPVMTLSEDLTKMSLSEKTRHDPVTEAVKKGKQPTVLEVKRSVKSLLRRLINITTHMDPLPKRRYATFKLFYTDDTPIEYEPPNFNAGDIDKNRWFFTTHDKDEAPERWRVGALDTGHHGVNVNVTSVAAYLPSPIEDSNATFTGTTTLDNVGPSLTPVQEATLRAQEAEIQLQDAETRNVAWAVPDEDLDAEGDLDPDYVRLEDGSYVLVTHHNATAETTVPIGLRNMAGEIEPFTVEEMGRRDETDPDTNMNTNEPHWGGESETVFSDVAAMNSKRLAEEVLLLGASATQVVGPSTPAPERRLEFTIGHSMASGQPLPSSDLSQSLPSFNPIPGYVEREGIDIDSIGTQVVKDSIRGGALVISNSDMLDLETQIVSSAPLEEDDIQSYGPKERNEDIDDEGIIQTERSTVDQIDNGLHCNCDVSIEDQCCFCEGGCSQWYHVWCMGYHSAQDNRIPSKFTCFDCRVRSDPHWDLIEVNFYSQMMSKYKDLALFRRAIKIAECENPETPTAFARMIGCEAILARQLFKRLEEEGFIEVQETTIDDFGLVETHQRSKSKKGKHSRQRKTLRKPRYRFNQASKQGTKYSEYFNPDRKVESHLLNLSNFKAMFKNISVPAASSPDVDIHWHNEGPSSAPQPSPRPTPLPQYESQTQEDSQSLMPAPATSREDLKRRTTATDPDLARSNKRMKVSVTPAVDLAE